MADKVNLTDQKRDLIARSDMYRQTLASDCQNLKEAASWVPRTFQAVRAVYPIFLLALPVAGFFLRRKAALKKPARKKKGLLGKAAVGIKIFRAVKPFWDGFRQPRRAHNYE